MKNWLSPKQENTSKGEVLAKQTKQLKAYEEALKRIANTYDNVEDLAGVIARETLDKYK